MDNKVFLSVLAILVVAIGAVFVLTSSDDTKSNNNEKEAAEIVKIDERNYRVKGPEDAPIELVEYGDFACSFCAQAFPQVEQLLAQYEGQVEFEFKPLSIPAGQNSVIAHRAAEAAGMQGKFFEMYELLYGNFQAWSQSTNAKELIDGYSEQIELDMDQYQTDYSAAETLDIINNLKAEATDIDVNSTPSFFVNGKKVETNGQFFQSIDQAISEVLSDQTDDTSDENSEN